MMKPSLACCCRTGSGDEALSFGALVGTVIPCGHQTALGSPLLIGGRAIDRTSSFTQLRIAYQLNRFGSYFPPTPSQGKNSRAIATLRPVHGWTGGVLGSRFLGTRMNSRSAASTM